MKFHKIVLKYFNILSIGFGRLMNKSLSLDIIKVFKAVFSL